MSVMHLDRNPRQDDVLRVLDTRLACLLVDRRGPEALRHNLACLRRKLASEPVDPATLAQVEATVRAISPAGTSKTAAEHAPARRWPQLQMGEMVARGLSGAVGLTGMAALLLQIS